MTRRGIAIALTALSFACSSADGDKLGSGNGQCTARAGSYLFKYTSRSGDCGNGGETVVNVTPQTSLDPSCKGTIMPTSDNCEVSYDVTCPSNATGQAVNVTKTGHSKFDTSGASGTATEAWSIRALDGRVLCQGTYDVMMTRQ